MTSENKIMQEKIRLNNTKIKYLLVVNKIYGVIKISFFHMTIEAVETDLTAANVPDNELWDINEFKDYRIKLVNNGGKIIDFEKWKDKRVI